MATQATLQVANNFPTGTTVGAYLAGAKNDGGAPKGASVTTAVVASNGTVAFTGLTDNTDYVAAAQVSSVWRYVSFSTKDRVVGLTVAPVALAGATYAQAEVNAAITALNQTMAALRAKGILT